MGYARKFQVSVKETPYYHVVSRCVRRGWLYGYDAYADKDYSHRKQWVIDRLAQLSNLFALDVCSYAVMSNHYHITLMIDELRAQSWSEEEVISRWTTLFALPRVVKAYQKGKGTIAEQDEARRTIHDWRQRLMNLSWFMRCLNEHLARKANAEDGCAGRFWEGRFKSQGTPWYRIKVAAWQCRTF